MKEFRSEAFNLPCAACEWSKVLRVLLARIQTWSLRLRAKKMAMTKSALYPLRLRADLSVPAVGWSAFGELAQGAAAGRRANRRSLVAERSRWASQSRRQGTAQRSHHRSIDGAVAKANPRQIGAAVPAISAPAEVSRCAERCSPCRSTRRMTRAT